MLRSWFNPHDSCQSKCLKLKISALVGVPKGEGLKIHVVGHLHSLDLLIHNAYDFHLHPFYLITVQTILTAAINPTLNPHRITRTILLVTFCLLACAEDPIVPLHGLAGFHLSGGFELDTLLTAKVNNALLIQIIVAWAGLAFAVQVAEADVVYLLVFLVGEPFWFLGVRFEASFEGIEDWIGMEGVIVSFDGVGLAVW